jgi:hypothetical protein
VISSFSSDTVALKCRARRADVSSVTQPSPWPHRAAPAVAALLVALVLSVAGGAGNGAEGPSGSATLVTIQQPVPPEFDREVAFADRIGGPAEPPTTAPVAAETPPPPPADPCADALAWVADAGLPLPPEVRYDCPSTQFAHHGTACWNGSPCRGSGFIAINMELMAYVSPEYLRHVVAHEVCHILDFQAKGWTTEAAADECAAAYGAP